MFTILDIGPETPTKIESRSQAEDEPEPGEVIRESPLKKESPVSVKTDTITKSETPKHSPSKTPKHQSELSNCDVKSEISETEKCEQKTDLSLSDKPEQTNSLSLETSPVKEVKPETEELEEGELVAQEVKKEYNSEQFKGIKQETEDGEIVKNETDTVQEGDIKTEENSEDVNVKCESKDVNGHPEDSKVEEDEEKIQAKFEVNFVIIIKSIIFLLVYTDVSFKSYV